MLVGVYVDEHNVAQALVRTCDGDGQVRGPWLRGTLEQPTDAATDDAETQDGEAEDAWIGWRARGAHAAVDFPLLTPPAQWEIEFRGPRTLQDSYVYELTIADPSQNYVYNGSVTFDTKDLAGLQPGHVFTSRGAMSQAEFEDGAQEAC